LKQKFAYFFLGVLLGAFLMQALVGKEMNRLYYEKEKWRIELYDTLELLNKTEEHWESQNSQLVSDVKLYFYPENDQKNSFTQLELKKEIREIVKGLIGQEIGEINPELAYKLLDQRIVQLEEKNFLIKVRSIVIAREILFHLEAEYLPELDAN